MQVRIRTQGVLLSADLEHFVERRLSHALERFEHRVRTVWVALLDLNGPKGGRDKQCRVRADCAPLGFVEADVLDERMESAVSRAADRISRQVRDLLTRRRDNRRRSDGEVINPWTV